MSMAQNPTNSNQTLPPPPTDEIEKVFKRFDSNVDRKISSSELCDVLSTLGSSPSHEELRRMMYELDSDGDEFIDLKEFVDFHCGGSGGGQDHRDGDLKEAFKLYDQDRDGLISASELHSVLKKLGEKCSLTDCSRMISSVDSDGDGKPGSQGKEGRRRSPRRGCRAVDGSDNRREGGAISPKIV